MPPLDIATIQPSLQAHLVPLGAQSIIHAKTLPNPWRQTTFSKSLKSYTGCFHVPRGRLIITAVATVETKYPAQIEHQQSSSLSSDEDPNGSSDDAEQLDDRERLRRMRISKANRGNTPWNKGRKHSPETLQKIRERTKIAMQDPKIKMKLSNLGHAQNEETRLKIGEGVRMRWARRKERRKVQETCHFEWQNLLAEAARKGHRDDQQEFQWDSYKILDKQNQLEWLESIEQRKAVRAAKGNRRAPKSPEQRRKIAEAIAAKWADPAYRERVCSGLAKYHGTPEGAERRRRRPSGTGEPRKKNPTVKTTRDSETVRKVHVVKVRKRRTPVYKDPLASSKLEMIRSIRAQRVAEESKKMDAVQRARLLISEAEKAAKVLEIAAMTSPVAQASLLESKKLIAEATQLIESLEISQVASDEDGTHHQPNTEDSNDQEQIGEVNGTHTLPINGESLHLNLRCSDLPTFNTEGTTLGMIQQPNGTRVDPPPPESNGVVKLTESTHLPNGSNACHGVEEKAESLESGNVTKKWVRGRLVEVTEAV